MWHDLYWGGKHAAGEERERAQPGGESQECSFTAASRGRGPRKQAPPGRRGSGRGGLRAAPGGAAALGFRPDRAGGSQEPATPPARVRCAPAPPSPARAAEASAAPVSAPGARRAVKPGPDGVADRTTWRRGRSGGRGKQRPRSGVLHPAGEAAEVPVGPREEKRAKPHLRLPRIRRCMSGLNRFWKSHIFQVS